MSLTRKAINFDIYTNELKKYFEDTKKPYGLIKDFMLENGFEHRQYSGYVSKEPIDNVDLNILFKKLSKKYSWIGGCIKEFDITEVGEEYSVKEVIQKLCVKELNKQTNHNKNFHTKLKNFKNQTQSNQKLREIER